MAAPSTKKDLRAAIIGNICVGKSVLFDELCSPTQRTEKIIPGTRVAVPKGRLRRRLLAPAAPRPELIDTPGSHSIFSQGEDAEASIQIILNGIDAILFTVDAKNLRRSLILALQLAEFEVPMVFALNMVDLAENRGITVDTKALQTALGVRTIPMIALERRGLEEIPGALLNAEQPRRPVIFSKHIEDTLGLVMRLLRGSEMPARALAVMLLGDVRPARVFAQEHFGKGVLDEVDRLVASLRIQLNRPPAVVLSEAYSKAAEHIARDCQVIRPRSAPFADRLGHWCQRPLTGVPAAALVVTAMYFFVGVFGATHLVDLLNNELFNQILTPWFTSLVAPIPSELIRDALMDPDFGILTTGLFLAFGIVLPVMLCFYLFFGILEQSGYLPRFSVLMHRLLQRIGLNGKGVIPLIMGVSCITMALLTTRMLDTRKERIIASFLLVLGLPCAPLLAVMLVVLGEMPWTATVFVALYLLAQIALAGVLANRIIPGRRTELLLELPPIRAPAWRSVVVMSMRRTYAFMKEAIPVFLLAALVIFVFDRVGGLRLAAALAQPLHEGLLGLPESSVRVFIKAVIRRESGAVELSLLAQRFDNLQLVVTMVTMTLAIPCINSVAVLFKERRMKTGFAILAATFAFALAAGGLVNHLCRAFGVTFS